MRRGSRPQHQSTRRNHQTCLLRCPVWGSLIHSFAPNAGATGRRTTCSRLKMTYPCNTDHPWGNLLDFLKKRRPTSALVRGEEPESSELLWGWGLSGTAETCPVRSAACWPERRGRTEAVPERGNRRLGGTAELGSPCIYTSLPHLVGSHPLIRYLPEIPTGPDLTF